MQRKRSSVRILIRIVDRNGKRRYCTPVFTRSGTPKGQTAIVNGSVEVHPEGVYSLRFTGADGRRLWEAVGRDPAYAYTAKLKRENALESVRLGLSEPEDGSRLKPPTLAIENRTPLRSSLDLWITEVTARRAIKTAAAYRKMVVLFVESCKKEFVEDLERSDITAFLDHLRSLGLAPRTSFNRVTYLRSYLRWAGRVSILTGSDLPRYTEKVVTAYGEREIRQMLKVATDEEAILIEFLVGTGLREGEVMHACFADIDFDRRLITVQDKPQYKFKVKDREERAVPISTSLTASLLMRRSHKSSNHLIFPAPNGQPDGHLLRRLKALHLRAGLNCGRCVSKGGKSCVDHPVCQKATLHKARKTFATLLSEAGMSLQTISLILGHSNLETTQKYLATADIQSARTRAQVDQCSSRLSNETSRSDEEFSRSIKPLGGRATVLIQKRGEIAPT